MEKLKDCPFCGSEVEIITGLNGIKVVCTNCSAEMESKYQDREYEIEEKLLTEEWNRRDGCCELESHCSMYCRP